MSPVPEIDSSRIFSAILASGVTNPVAIERGSELVDHWSQECAVADQRYRTLGLEVGWFIALDERTYIVGACDKVAFEPGSDNESPFVFEAKTTAAGSKNWTPEKWYDEMVAGHQLGTYALALHQGTFIPRDENDMVREEKEFRVANPRIFIRAVSKSKPPQIWPSPEGAFVDISQRKLDVTLAAYQNVAVAIRAQHMTNVVPWQLPGKWCAKTYGYKEYKCQHWDICRGTMEFPIGYKLAGLSPGSASVVSYLLETGKIKASDKDLVVLSSSSVGEYFQCPEKFRQSSFGSQGEESEALDTGTVFHAGLAQYGRQLQAQGW